MPVAAPRTWTKGQITVAYADEGAGPLIVAVHGVPGGRRDFRRLAAELTPGFRVVRLDLPGFGESPPAPAVDSPARAAACIVDFLADLGEPAILVGHSMGGAVALRVAVAAPARVRGLALLASPGLRPHRIYFRRTAQVFSRLLRHDVVARLLARPIAHVYARAGLPTNTSPISRVLGIHYGAGLHFADQRRLVAQLRTPTLVAWADDDRLVEPEILAEMADACPPGPRLHFARAGHNLPGRVPAELAAAIAAWSPTLP